MSGPRIEDDPGKGLGELEDFEDGDDEDPCDFDCPVCYPEKGDGE